LQLSKQAIKDYNRGRMYLADLANRDGVPVFENISEAMQCVVNKCLARWAGALFFSLSSIRSEPLNAGQQVLFFTRFLTKFTLLLWFFLGAASNRSSFLIHRCHILIALFYT
jgi:hypothetical protein